MGQYVEWTFSIKYFNASVLKQENLTGSNQSKAGGKCPYGHAQLPTPLPPKILPQRRNVSPNPMPGIDFGVSLLPHRHPHRTRIALATRQPRDVRFTSAFDLQRSRNSAVLAALRRCGVAGKQRNYRHDFPPHAFSQYPSRILGLRISRVLECPKMKWRPSNGFAKQQTKVTQVDKITLGLRI